MTHKKISLHHCSRKGRGTRDQIVNIHWIMEKEREFQKNICFCFDYAKAFDCVDHKIHHLPKGSSERSRDLLEKERVSVEMSLLVLRKQ